MITYVNLSVSNFTSDPLHSYRHELTSVFASFTEKHQARFSWVGRLLFCPQSSFTSEEEADELQCHIKNITAY